MVRQKQLLGSEAQGALEIVQSVRKGYKCYQERREEMREFFLYGDWEKEFEHMQCDEQAMYERIICAHLCWHHNVMTEIG